MILSHLTSIMHPAQIPQFSQGRLAFDKDDEAGDEDDGGDNDEVG